MTLSDLEGRDAKVADLHNYARTVWPRPWDVGLNDWPPRNASLLCVGYHVCASVGLLVEIPGRIGPLASRRSRSCHLNNTRFLLLLLLLLTQDHRNWQAWSGDWIPISDPE